MNAEQHLREVVWHGQRSWLGGEYGGGYDEIKAEFQTYELDGFSVGIRRTRYISRQPGTSNQSWGPDVCIWHFSVSDGSRGFDSNWQHTECLPSILAVRRVDDKVVVSIIPRVIKSGKQKGQMLSEVVCFPLDEACNWRQTNGAG